MIYLFRIAAALVVGIAIIEHVFPQSRRWIPFAGQSFVQLAVLFLSIFALTEIYLAINGARSLFGS